MIALRKAAGLVTQGAVYLRKASGLVEQEVYLRTAAGLKLIHSPSSTPFTVDISGDAYGATASPYAQSVTTSNVTVTPTGGAAPYSYAWAEVSGPFADWSILSPSSASTAFRKGLVSPGDNEFATYACTVTDANGNSVVSDTITANVANYGGLGGPIP